MSLVVYYGGTYDPVHDGHLAIARAARDLLQAPIAMMPAADPPHRLRPGASAGQRADMLELAVANEVELCVDRRELRRDAPSYSVDTLRELRAEHGETVSIILLLGADSFRSLPTWKDWRALFGLCHFVVAERADSPLGTGLAASLADELGGRWTGQVATLRSRPSGCVLPLRQPLHAASSSRIRRAIAAGEPWRQDLPPAVADYIERHHLYRDGAPAVASAIIAP